MLQKFSVQRRTRDLTHYVIIKVKKKFKRIYARSSWHFLVSPHLLIRPTFNLLAIVHNFTQTQTHKHFEVICYW